MERKTKWLYATITILALLLISQTSLILLRDFNSSKNVPHPASTISSRLYSLPQPLSSAPKAHPHPPSAHLQTWNSDDSFFADSMAALQNMSQMMNSLMNSAMTSHSSLMNQMMSSPDFDFTPAIDLEETDTAYIVRGDLPGLDKDKIDVTVHNNLLTIQGIRETSSKTEDQRKGYYAQERSYGSFARTISLPGPVDETNIQAAYHDGVLTITLPKTENVKATQKIAVQ